eukprot:scaffold912_cov108-Isochrysis_galbana.AAC.3
MFNHKRPATNKEQGPICPSQRTEDIERGPYALPDAHTSPTHHRSPAPPRKRRERSVGLARARDELLHNLVGPAVDAVHAGVGELPRHRRLPHEAHPAVQLPSRGGRRRGRDGGCRRGWLAGTAIGAARPPRPMTVPQPARAPE